MSDETPKTDIFGKILFPSHIGTIFKSDNAVIWVALLNRTNIFSPTILFCRIGLELYGAEAWGLRREQMPRDCERKTRVGILLAELAHAQAAEFWQAAIYLVTAPESCVAEKSAVSTFALG